MRVLGEVHFYCCRNVLHIAKVIDCFKDLTQCGYQLLQLLNIFLYYWFIVVLVHQLDHAVESIRLVNDRNNKQTFDTTDDFSAVVDVF